ncbi:UvrD-helicase domain-containing protein [Patescibacteria group bacterium]|nr:UvrD-helicase domain-containing protein [Patescibacteria group bacterium]
MSKYFEQLNDQQKKAVIQKDGPILILAGAGAGKTRTITHRILNLIQEGVHPSSILAVTFTNKAAKEMRERVGEMLNEDKQINFPVEYEEKPFVSTFHSLGVHILKENAHEIGMTRYFNIFDRNDSKRAVKEAILQSNLDPKQFDPGKILSIISHQKGDFKTHETFKKNSDNEYFNQIISDVWIKYEQTLKKENSLDFDDLLLKTALLLKNNKIVREKYQNQWKYIHIDEYQDTNKVQYEISKLLTKKDNQNICVVGDIDQNIYSWRGADIKNIFNFEKDFSNVTTILLEENYRSTQTILSAANDIIKKNKTRKEKNLFTKNSEGEKISLISAYTERQEASAVAQNIKKLFNEKVPAGEIAILYRANYQSRVLEEAFLMENIPYQVLGTKFFERKEVKDIISFIKASLNPESLTDMKRIINVPPRGIGKLTILKLFSNKESELSPAMQLKIQKFRELMENIKTKALEEKPSNIIKFIIKETGIEQKLQEGNDEDLERLANIGELVTLSMKYDALPTPNKLSNISNLKEHISNKTQSGIEKLLEDATLASDQDEIDQKKEQKDAIKLMTVHASKGLEFDYIFITGLEDTLFPSKRFGEKQTETQKEEERRLFYVALTRARKKIFLSYASIRTIFGSKQMNPPSEFIFDINDDLIENDEKIEGSGEKIIYLEL